MFVNFLCELLDNHLEGIYIEFLFHVFCLYVSIHSSIFQYIFPYFPIDSLQILACLELQSLRVDWQSSGAGAPLVALCRPRALHLAAGHCPRTPCSATLPVPTTQFTIKQQTAWNALMTQMEHDQTDRGQSLNLD